MFVLVPDTVESNVVSRVWYGRMLPSSVGGRYAPHRHGSSYAQSMSVSWSLPDYLRRMFDYHQVSQNQIGGRPIYPKLRL